MKPKIFVKRKVKTKTRVNFHCDFQLGSEKLLATCMLIKISISPRPRPRLKNSSLPFVNYLGDYYNLHT